MIIINIFDNNYIKLNNVMCITESINIDIYQAKLKAFIQHYGTIQDEHKTSVIKKGGTWYHFNYNQIKGNNLSQEINDAYILFDKC